MYTCCTFFSTHLTTYTYMHTLPLSPTSQTMLLLQFGWWVEPLQWRVVLKSTTMVSGGQSVMIFGTNKMPKLSATSLDFLDM